MKVEFTPKRPDDSDTVRILTYRRTREAIKRIADHYNMTMMAWLDEAISQIESQIESPKE